MVYYLVFINLCAFAAMGMDKHRARRHEWRIPEKALFALALLGGAGGGWLGMQLFRHKTKHWYFAVGFPAIFVAEAAAALWFIMR